MRRVWLSKEDFGLFHQDITPLEYEFFRSHGGAFKRMWTEQSRRFWALFVNAFEHFIWNYGIMKEFPMKVEEAREYIDEIVFYIRDQFVDGRIATAKALVVDCVIVTQNRNCIAQLDKAAYAQNPFYMKDTREVFRQLFGPPTDKKTFMKVLCGLPVYIKFAGAAVACLRRWLSAESIPSDEKLEAEFLETVYRQPKAERLSKEEIMRAVGRLEQQATSETCKEVSSKENKTEDSNNIEEKEGGGEENEAERDAKRPEDDGGLKKKRKKKKKKSSGGFSLVDVGEGEGKKQGDGEVSGKSSGGKPKETKAVTEEGVEGAGEESDGSSCSSPHSTADSGIGSIAGAEPVSTEITLAADEVLPSSRDSEGRRRRLHFCACCGCAETVAKTFKRCQKCRGLANPNYYCSRECQAKHWSTHKLDHRGETAATTSHESSTHDNNSITSQQQS